MYDPHNSLRQVANESHASCVDNLLRLKATYFNYASPRIQSGCSTPTRQQQAATRPALSPRPYHSSQRKKLSGCGCGAPCPPPTDGSMPRRFCAGILSSASRLTMTISNPSIDRPVRLFTFLGLALAQGRPPSLNPRRRGNLRAPQALQPGGRQRRALCL